MIPSPETPTVKNKTVDPINSIDLYPNPVDEYLNINIKNPDYENLRIEVYNIIGNKVDIKPEKLSYDKYRISIKDFVSGYYLLMVRDNKNKLNTVLKFKKD